MLCQEVPPIYKSHWGAVVPRPACQCWQGQCLSRCRHIWVQIPAAAFFTPCPAAIGTASIKRFSTFNTQPDTVPCQGLWVCSLKLLLWVPKSWFWITRKVAPYTVLNFLDTSTPTHPKEGFFREWIQRPDTFLPQLEGSCSPSSRPEYSLLTDSRLRCSSPTWFSIYHFSLSECLCLLVLFLFPLQFHPLSPMLSIS